jgi:hemerythrin-like domain-containing protein
MNIIITSISPTKPKVLAGLVATQRAILYSLPQYEEHVNNLRSIDQIRARKLQNWFNYVWGLVENHHQSEDAELFPTVAQRAAAFQHHIRALNIQHNRLEQLSGQLNQDLNSLQVVTKVVDRLALEYQFKKRLEKFRAEMVNHLGYKERVFIPALTNNYSEAEQKAIEDKLRQNMSLDFMSRLFPWMLEALAPKEASEMLEMLPGPVQNLYHQIWKPQFDHMMAAWRS